MAEREDAIDQMSGVRKDARARIDAALVAILALCWDYRSPDFTFSGHIALQREANRILAEMSDGNLSDAERRAKLALVEAELQEYEDDAIEFAETGVGDEDTLFRLDRQADHLKDLIAGWLAVAAFIGLSQSETRRMFWTYIKDPMASKEWRDAGLKAPRWGRGFPVDVLTGTTVIEQDFINRAFQYARIQWFKASGAIGYRTVRQSFYYCPFCDEMAKKVWPLEMIVLPYHPRCVCKAVPVYSDDK